MDMASPKSTTTSLPHPISDVEAKHYYYGLYSKPVLIARTGNDTWERPTGPEAYFQPKELRTVGNHPLKAVWEDNLAFRIHDILECKGVEWTSTDVARIGFVGEPVTPVLIWIGVKPNTLSREDVEIRESVVTRYISTKLRKPVRSTDPTAELLEPLTSTLGPFICNASTPWAEDTGGFYVTDDKSNLYLVTARHVVFKPDQDNNDTYERKNSSQPRVNVALFGTAAFNSYVEQIKCTLEDQEVIIEFQERRAKEAREGDNGMDGYVAVREHSDAKRLIKEAKDAIVAFEKLYDDVVKDWSKIENRVLGFVIFSPPIEISDGPNKYTQDYALVKVDSSKIDAASFTANAIDLGTQIALEEFTRLMYPHHTNSHTFKYPTDRLFKVKGMVPDKEMRHPTIMDENDEPCLLVMKRGNTTGLTLGRANDILSFVRNYFDNGETKTSKEWAIYPYDNKSGPFSAKGDSGSGIVDCLGRLGGLLTGGNGRTDSSDITYATPISFIIDSLKDNGYKVTTEATLTA
ncbi:hypothetical protein L873DRAFT_1815937 [Choiromyces venosus 120613-1]|uniref:Uncharacterized protein n=1 Tax=Choiromyces venosus 120613-1 TaxID=1336337 RepID=A0A3N4JHP4_9PEZI|nr:hypothetical protein L873DRAFT_1815937 [Choiromyces venosus 120613-1]